MKTLLFNKSGTLTDLCEGKIKETVKKSGAWFNSLSNEDASTLGRIIVTNKLEEEVNARFSDEDSEDCDEFDGFNYDFEINSTMKKIFIAYLLDIRESERGVGDASRHLKEVEAFESRYNKSILSFTEDEVVESIKEMGSKNSVHNLKNKIEIFRDYYSFYEPGFLLSVDNNNWNKNVSFQRVVDIIGSDMKEPVLTKDNLIELSKQLINPQQSIIPLLMFEGLSYSKQESDTLRFLKKSDIREDGLFVKAYTEKRDSSGNRLSVDRVIDIDKDVMDLVNIAARSNVIAKMSKGELSYLPLRETEYLLAPSAGRRHNSGGDEISYGGVYERLKYCGDQLVTIGLSLESFSGQYISNCGKSHYIVKYMKDGLTEREAVIKVLQRFGEWNYRDDRDVKKEALIPSNKTRIGRLTKRYSLFLNK